MLVVMFFSDSEQCYLRPAVLIYKKNESGRQKHTT